MTGRDSGTLPPTTGRTCPIGTESEACLQSISGHFEPAEAKCGDRIYLHADATNIPSSTAVFFAVFDYRSDRIVDRLSGQLQGSQVRNQTWESKKEDNQWHEPHLYFIVNSLGEVAQSDNMFTFHRYDDFRRRTIEFPRTGTSTTTGTTWNWTSKYTMEFDDRRLIIRIRIKLINRQGPQPTSPTDPNKPPAGDPVEDSLKRRMKRHIEGYLTNRWILHREQCTRGSDCDCPKERKCCKFEVFVRVHFVERRAHHEVDLFQGTPNWTNMTGWCRQPWNDNDWPHEVGHMLGWYDEYPEGANGPSPWQSLRAGAVMSYSAPGGQRLLPRFYYNTFKRHFQERVGETWELLQVP